MKKTKQNNNNFWIDLWELLKPSRTSIKKLFVLIIVLELVRLLEPYLLKLIIDKLITFQVEDIPIILILILLTFFILQIISFVHYFFDKLILKASINIEHYLPLNAQKKLMYLPLSYHEDENTGNKITKIERGVNRVVELFDNTFWQVIPTLIQAIIAFTVLLMVDWRFGLSFIIFASLFIWLTIKVNKKLQPSRKERHKNYEIASGIIGQSIININSVKSFVQEEKEIKKYKKIRDIIKKRNLTEFLTLIKFNIGRNFIIDLGRIVVLLLGIFLISNNKITIGTLVFVISLSERAYFSLYRLSRFYDKIEEAKEAVVRFILLLNKKQTIQNPKNGIKLDNTKGEIKFSSLSFSYNSDNKKVLNNINFKIIPDSTTALVGPSGGGKTTLARMIYRHYDPQKGEVLLDGINLKDYDLYSFRKHIAIVPQEVEIFDMSIRNNIAYGKSNVSDKEIKAVAKIANASEFIEKLKNNYDTKVGERGVKLSGGQKQRIGIARAILVNPKILIFDEATSNLDSYSEKLIQDAMDKIMKNRTVIIIAHRLSTIKKANKIVVLEEGKIVEQGNHIELSKKNGGLYSKLLKLQEVGDVE
ncbi:ABC transporter ATP-binding protein [Candidatus Parcubacteria bacterium]|nr:ABC transporter ATP-binding protein [Candidatus Parcubacteria bacterium]